MSVGSPKQNSNLQNNDQNVWDLQIKLKAREKKPHN